ncbi:MAG: tetratricopeptide repeat protein [Planctomycetes bacterium]|nr:tetratricopeptide repeat protein [Planctomycetota bacterium]
MGSRPFRRLKPPAKHCPPFGRKRPGHEGRPTALSAILTALSSLALAAVSWAGEGQAIEQLEKQVQANPGDLAARAALAEACLRECDLEKSLAHWQVVLKQAPDHERAKLVVARLTAQALDLDTHLLTLQRLVEKGIVEGTGPLLDAAAQRAATNAQKAHILHLRGLFAAAANDPARAHAHFEAAMRLYPHTTWAAHAAIALAEADFRAATPKPKPAPKPDELLPEQEEATPPASQSAISNQQSAIQAADRARRLLQSVASDQLLPDPAVKELASLRLLLIDTLSMTNQERVAALRDWLPKAASPAVRRQALDALAQHIAAAQGRWVPEAVEAVAVALKTEPSDDEAAAILRQLRQIAEESRDPATLDALLALLRDAQWKSPALVDDAAMLRVEALLARAAVAAQTAAMQGFMRDAHALLDAALDRAAVQVLRGRALLLEAQKLIALEGPLAALPLLTRAKDHYLAILPANPQSHLASLRHIGHLLEQVQEWETAVALYREIATRFPHLPQGRDALIKVARLYEGRLNAPLAALETYAAYAAHYPADLPYRQLDVGQRLRQLGYASVLDFQKQNRLKPDGQFGTASRARLAELEAAFDLIRAQPTPDSGILRGEFVHRQVFAIARALQDAGRDYDALGAYRTFLCLFPTKREGDDALLAVARIFAANTLFSEALGAYAEMMEQFPNGDKTSEAYVEAAKCHENLGEWDAARELYQLYLKKFPKFRHAALCEARIPLLAELRQYEGFIASNPQSPKLAEAQYQIATILYKSFESFPKAAVEFAQVAERHPKHVRAADALFTAGTAQLRAENFPAARELFERLVRDYPDTRLTDDAQFWIGHTHEYAARALGRLDARHVVLKRRSLDARARLLADLPLRRQYHPQAQPGPELPETPWGADTLGVLASGSVRDRVNADLLRAVSAYQQVVDKFKMGDMAGAALLRIGTIHAKYLKDPDKGMAAFQQLLEHHPGSKEAIGALLEVGAYHLEKKNHDEAIKVYQKFVYNYPQEAACEDAMLAIARCHGEKKAWDKALDAFQTYLNRYPQGKHAPFAKDQATWIRMYHF